MPASIELAESRLRKLFRIEREVSERHQLVVATVVAEHTRQPPSPRRPSRVPRPGTFRLWVSPSSPRRCTSTGSKPPENGRRVRPRHQAQRVYLLSGLSTPRTPGYPHLATSDIAPGSRHPARLPSSPPFSCLPRMLLLRRREQTAVVFSLMCSCLVCSLPIGKR